MPNDGDGSRPGPDESDHTWEQATVHMVDGETPVRRVVPAGGNPLPGDILAGRFRIVRFIARGGMGEAYEAEDLELGDRLALKTIRSTVAKEPALMARFRREVQLARRVTHPNVSRIFDVWRRLRRGDSGSSRGRPRALSDAESSPGTRGFLRHRRWATR